MVIFMAKILISPSKYVQAAGEMSKLGGYAEKYGKKALVLITSSGYRRIGDIVDASFSGRETTPVYEYFGGECSKNEINRLISVAGEKGCDVIIGIGGGKILDTAKAVAYYKNLPVLICPTVASTDAPCSALSVIYTDEGVFEEYLFRPANPNMVLMDTDIITKSPVRLTVSGMGDALATYFEARACRDSGASTCAGGKVTEAAMALARLCFDTLMDEGVKAKIALEAGACTPAVEKIVEANTLLSGIGFESGGLAGAHAIHNGLTVLEECVVVGRSNIVGKPMAMLLLHKNATVTIAHSKTKELSEVCRRADILVVAVGRAGLITGDMIKDGAVVIDVGMNRNEQGKLCGDVDFESVYPKAAKITPVPGGVGPMTITTLLQNTVTAAKLRHPELSIRGLPRNST